MGLTRRLLLLAPMVAGAGALAARTLISAVEAAEPRRFDLATFHAAVKKRQPILVHITAPWCGTCRVQKPIVAKLAARPDFQDFAFFEVDFDSQRSIVSKLGAVHQSTMVVFRGDTEIDRSVGVRAAGQIEAMLRKAL